MNKQIEEKIKNIIKLHCRYCNPKGGLHKHRCEDDIEDQTKDIMDLLSQSKKDVIEVLKKQLPKEQGFNDYSKHVHTYVTENRGNCGICGLSWKKTTEYGCYNTALREVKKILKIYLLSLKDKEVK